MSSSSSNWEPPSPEHLQRMLPQYEITDILGRGGMGAVYKGRQSNLDREVAIKVLPETFTKGDDELNFAARFKQEARAMAKLDHPAILSVYDFGETAEGQLYFVMEFIDGMDIQQYLHHHGGKLPQEQALSITAHVLDALDYAHSQGIVHRDIKPANILLNREGRVKIADFGLAKKLEEAGGDSVPALTMTNVAVGTPDFVAPEALDSDQKPDHRADLYAVGVMLYQMLTGKLPRGQFKSPSELDPTIDPRLDEIVSKAMQPHPDDRYSSAGMVRSDLDVIFSKPFAKVEAGEESAVVAAVVPVTTSVKGKPPAKAGRYTPAVPERSKLPLVLGIGGACVALVGLIIMATRGKPEAESAAVPPTKMAETPHASPSAPKVPLEAEVKVTETKAVPASTTSPGAAEKTSTSPPLPSSPPGQWVKVFSKVEDLPANIQKQINPENWDGWIPPQLIDLPRDLKTNYAVRARFRAAATPQERSYISVRREHSDSVASLMTTGAEVVGQVRSASGIDYFLKAKNPNPIPAGGDYEVEFAVVGNRFMARLDSSVFQSAEAKCPAEGAARIDAKSAVRDIEVLNLDGLPEVEALRLLGVDEQGRELRSSQPGTTAPGQPTTMTEATQTAKSPAVSAEQDFPPGQWVKMFTKLEDLPPGLQALQPKENSDGWIKVEDSEEQLNLPRNLEHNYAVKASIRLSSSGENKGSRFVLRASNSSNYQSYVSNTRKLFIQKYQDGKYVTYPDQPQIGNSALAPGEILPFEFGVVGQRLVARIGSKAFYSVVDSSVGNGTGLIHVRDDFRDIEVINLDGLPEAEALRILGVDEKGNDLRAAAAKEEQQKAEEAKKTDALSAIPELKALHDQFLALEKTRVTNPFAAELAKLNTGYLGGLDRAIADEKRGGNLDGVLAIEQEKTLLSAGEAVPTEDGDATPEALKKLRGIYREAHAKLETTRAANRLALTTPLATRLKQIEADLTRQDRIEHAKTVRDYREALESPTEKPAADKKTESPAAPVSAEATKTERVRPDPKISRAAAEYAMDRGADVIILSEGIAGVRFKPGSPLPDGDFELGAVYFPIGLGLEISDADVVAITRASELRIFSVGEGNNLTFQSLAPFRNTPLIRELIVHSYGEITAENCEVVASLPLLERLGFGNSSALISDLSRLLSPPSLNSLSFSGRRLRPEDGAILNGYPKLKFLNIGGSGMGDLLLQMGDMDQIEELTMSFTQVTATNLEALNKNLKKTLVSLQFGQAEDDSSAAVDVAIRRFPKLETLFPRGKISEEVLLKLPALKELTTLTLHQAEFTPQSFEALSQCRKLTRLTIGNGRITADDITALRRLENLEALTLRDNGIHIDPEAIPKFALLKNLTKLELAESQTTDEQIAALSKEMPNCAVSRIIGYQ